MNEVMQRIREECKPLFRYLPVTVDNLSTYRPRESSKQKEQGEGKGKGKAEDGESTEDSSEEGPPEMKWVMVRYPWEFSVPQEQERPVLVVARISRLLWLVDSR